MIEMREKEDDKEDEERQTERKGKQNSELKKKTRIGIPGLY
jgi:hypothetical protein